jgi:prepilin-type N-terminal cleavage/methylation domain-containing protein
LNRDLGRGGFTLIELLIVIGVIGVLTAITLVASKVVGEGSKVRATQDLIRSLEGALLAYSTDTGKIPLPYVEDPRGETDPAFRGLLIPVADARNMDIVEAKATPPGEQMINSVGLLMEQLRSVPSAKAQLDTIPQKFVREFDAYPTKAASMKPVPVLRTVFDPWGQPLRYVHPSYSGTIVKDPAMPTDGRATFSSSDPSESVLGPAPISRRPGVVSKWAINVMRRSDAYDSSLKPQSGTDSLDIPTASKRMSDADGGSCANNTPYFYSLGPDKKAGVFVPVSTSDDVADFNKDNVYTVAPSFRGKRTSKS